MTIESICLLLLVVLLLCGALCAMYMAWRCIRLKVKLKGKGKCIAVCINTYNAAGNHLPYGITQCYLPHGRGDFPTFTPAEAGTRFSDPEGMQG